MNAALVNQMDFLHPKVRPTNKEGKKQAMLLLELRQLRRGQSINHSFSSKKSNSNKLFSNLDMKLMDFHRCATERRKKSSKKSDSSDEDLSNYDELDSSIDKELSSKKSIGSLLCSTVEYFTKAQQFPPTRDMKVITKVEELPNDIEEVPEGKEQVVKKHQKQFDKLRIISKTKHIMKANLKYFDTMLQHEIINHITHGNPFAFYDYGGTNLIDLNFKQATNYDCS